MQSFSATTIGAQGSAFLLGAPEAAPAGGAGCALIYNPGDGDPFLEWTTGAPLTEVSAEALASVLPLADLSGLATSDPGSGRIWANGGFLAVGDVGAPALDAAVAHLAGAETFIGEKTFEDAVVIHGTAGQAHLTCQATAGIGSRAYITDRTLVFTNDTQGIVRTRVGDGALAAGSTGITFGSSLGCDADGSAIGHKSSRRMGFYVSNGTSLVEVGYWSSTTLAVSGNQTIGGTLGVTGNSTLADIYSSTGFIRTAGGSGLNIELKPTTTITRFNWNGASTIGSTIVDTNSSNSRILQYSSTGATQVLSPAGNALFPTSITGVSGSHALSITQNFASVNAINISKVGAGSAVAISVSDGQSMGLTYSQSTTATTATASNYGGISSTMDSGFDAGSIRAIVGDATQNRNTAGTNGGRPIGGYFKATTTALAPLGYGVQSVAGSARVTNFMATGISSQSGNYFEAQTSGGVTEFSVAPGGNTTIAGTLSAGATTVNGTFTAIDATGPSRVTMAGAGGNAYGFSFHPSGLTDAANRALWGSQVATVLNVPSAGTLYLRIGNSTVASATTTGFYFGGGLGNYIDASSGNFRIHSGDGTQAIQAGSSTITISKATTFSSTLGVTGAATFSSNVFVSGNIGGASQQVPIAYASQLINYRTFTDVSNYERARMLWSSTTFTIATDKAGTGLARGLALQTDGTDRLTISSTGATAVTGTLTVASTVTVSGVLNVNTHLAKSGSGDIYCTVDGGADLGQWPGVRRFRNLYLTGEANCLDLNVTRLATLSNSNATPLVINRTTAGGNVTINWQSAGVSQFYTGVQYGTGKYAIGYNANLATDPSLEIDTVTKSINMPGSVTIGGILNLPNSAPASAADTGTAGDIKRDADYIYVCTATDTWKRAALASW